MNKTIFTFFYLITICFYLNSYWSPIGINAFSYLKLDQLLLHAINEFVTVFYTLLIAFLFGYITTKPCNDSVKDDEFSFRSEWPLLFAGGFLILVSLLSNSSYYLIAGLGFIVATFASYKLAKDKLLLTYFVFEQKRRLIILFCLLMPFIAIFLGFSSSQYALKREFKENVIWVGNTNNYSNLTNTYYYGSLGDFSFFLNQSNIVYIIPTKEIKGYGIKANYK